MEFYFEHLMMGLRLVQGVSKSRLMEVFGIPPDNVAPRTFSDWKNQNLLVDEGDRIHMSQKGILLLDGFLRAVQSEIEENNISPIPKLRWPGNDV